METFDTVSLIKDSIAYVVALVLVIINVISLKWYKKKEDAQSEQIKMLDRAFQLNEKLSKERTDNLEMENIKSFKIIKEREDTLALMERLIQKERSIIDNEKEHAKTADKSIVEPSINTIEQKLERIEASIVDVKETWQKPVAEVQAERVNQKLNESPRKEPLLNITTLSYEDNARLNKIFEMAHYSLDSMTFCEVTAGIKATMARANLCDIVFHFSRILKEEIPQDEVSNHILSMEEHLKRAIVEPIEMVIIDKIEKLRVSLKTSPFLGMFKSKDHEQEKESIIKLQRLYSKVREIKVDSSIWDDDFQATCKNIMEEVISIKAEESFF